MANEMKAVCGGFLVGEGLEMDGKVLKASRSADSVFVINFEGYGNNITCDKTFEEVKQAYRSGKTLLANHGGSKLNLMYCNDDGEDIWDFDFSLCSCNEKHISVETIVLDYDDTIKRTNSYSRTSPSVEGTCPIQFKNNAYKIFLNSFKPSQIYETYLKHHMSIEFPEIVDRNVYTGVYYTLEYCDATKVVFSKKVLNDDGTITITMLTGTGDSYNLTAVSKTLS